MSVQDSYRLVTEVTEKITKSLEERKEEGSVYSFSIEAIYDDLKIEIRIVMLEGMPEFVFTLDVLNGKQL
jgi:hypothetical protein